MSVLRCVRWLLSTGKATVRPAFRVLSLSHSKVFLRMLALHHVIFCSDVPAIISPAPTVSSVTQTTAVVSWTQPYNGGSAILSYMVTMATGGSTSFTAVATVNAPALSTQIAGLTAGTMYAFEVYAVNGIGNGSPSASSASVTTLAAGTPAQVSPLPIVSAVRKTSLALTWVAPNNGGSAITGYQILMQTGNANFVVQTANTASTAVTASITGLLPGQSYSFEVRFPCFLACVSLLLRSAQSTRMATDLSAAPACLSTRFLVCLLMIAVLILFVVTH